MNGEDGGDDRGLPHHAKRCLGKKFYVSPKRRGIEQNEQQDSWLLQRIASNISIIRGFDRLTQ